MQAELQSYFQYLKFEKRYSEHTLLAYQNDLSHCQAYLKTQYDIEIIEAIEFVHLRSWLVQLLEEGISQRSIHRKMAAIKSFFKYLKRENKVLKNPTSQLIAPKIPKRLPSYIEEKQMDYLFDKIEFSDDYRGWRDQTILELLYATGMRRAELINIKINDIDEFQQSLKVLGKRNKERIIPLSPKMIDLLKKYIEIRNNEFPKNKEISLFLTIKGKPLYPKAVYNIVHHYLSLVSTNEKKSPHVLRHTFATHLTNKGADLNAVKELLGHANLAATQIYVHNSIERLKEVYQKAHPKENK